MAEAGGGPAPLLTEGKPTATDVLPVAERVAKPVVKPAAKADGALDDLWADMNKPIKPRGKGKKSGPAKRAAPKVDPMLAGMLGLAVPKKSGSDGRSSERKGGRQGLDRALAGWVEQDAARKPGAVNVKRLEELTSAAAAEEAQAAAEEVRKKELKKTGLEGVLGAIKGEKQASVMERSRKAWNDVKGKDEEIADELDAYKKDKNRYTDRVAFLERTDRREWEVDLSRKRGR